MRIASLACVVLLLALAGCKQSGNPPAPTVPSSPTAADADRVAAPGAIAGAPAAAAPEAGAPAAPASEPEFPTLRVRTVDGRDYDLQAARGRWVVVNFWATWCAPCLKEMPELSALDAMRDHVDVIGLAYDDIAPGELAAFLAERPVSYPIAQVDVYAPPADFATPRGLPMTYLVDPDGRVAKKFLGPITAMEIEAAIHAAGGPDAGGPGAAGAEARGPETRGAVVGTG